MKSKIINILISSLFFSILLYPQKSEAKNVAPGKVKKVALNVFSNRFGIDKNVIEISEIIPVSANGEVIFTIFNLNPKGHIIISNDDVADPILGYGFESHIDFRNIPPGLEYLLGEYKSEILSAKKQKLKSNETIQEKWMNYSSDEFELGLKSYTVGDHLLETQWGQGLAFNDSCPDDPVTHSQCVVGCVGVALGQVLNYWGCRVFPDGSVSPYTPDRFSSSISLNFYDKDYNWNDIGSVPGATAQFLYHCAVAVESDFGDSNIGTSADFNMVRFALVNYFGFNAQNPVLKTSYLDNQWKNMLKNEIDAERPVIYTGKCDTCSKGHAWVIDGYDIYDKFHCNWGWTGQDNGFYSLSDLTPDNEDYTSDQRAVLGIEPILDACSGLDGADIICSSNESYSVSIPSTASVVWSKSSSLNEVGGNTSTTYTVSPATSGTSGYVSATIKNSQGNTFLVRNKEFWIGSLDENKIVCSRQGQASGAWAQYHILCDEDYTYAVAGYDYNGDGFNIGDEQSLANKSILEYDWDVPSGWIGTLPMAAVWIMKRLKYRPTGAQTLRRAIWCK